jgi:hypothetical protein
MIRPRTASLAARSLPPPEDVDGWRGVTVWSISAWTTTRSKSRVRAAAHLGHVELGGSRFGMPVLRQLQGRLSESCLRFSCLAGCHCDVVVRLSLEDASGALAGMGTGPGGPGHTRWAGGRRSAAGPSRGSAVADTAPTIDHTHPSGQRRDVVATGDDPCGAAAAAAAAQPAARWLLPNHPHGRPADDCGPPGGALPVSVW